MFCFGALRFVVSLLAPRASIGRTEREHCSPSNPTGATTAFLPEDKLKKLTISAAPIAEAWHVFHTQDSSRGSGVNCRILVA